MLTPNDFSTRVDIPFGALIERPFTEATTLGQLHELLGDTSTLYVDGMSDNVRNPERVRLERQQSTLREALKVAHAHARELSYLRVGDSRTSREMASGSMAAHALDNYRVELLSLSEQLDVWSGEQKQERANFQLRRIRSWTAEFVAEIRATAAEKTTYGEAASFFDYAILAPLLSALDAQFVVGDSVLEDIAVTIEEVIYVAQLYVDLYFVEEPTSEQRSRIARYLRWLSFYVDASRPKMFDGKLRNPVTTEVWSGDAYDQFTLTVFMDKLSLRKRSPDVEQTHLVSDELTSQHFKKWLRLEAEAIALQATPRDDEAEGFEKMREARWGARRSVSSALYDAVAHARIIFWASRQRVVSIVDSTELPSGNANGAAAAHRMSKNSFVSQLFSGWSSLTPLRADEDLRIKISRTQMALESEANSIKVALERDVDYTKSREPTCVLSANVVYTPDQIAQMRRLAGDGGVMPSHRFTLWCQGIVASSPTIAADDIGQGGAAVLEGDGDNVAQIGDRVTHIVNTRTVKWPELAVRTTERRGGVYWYIVERLDRENNAVASGLSFSATLHEYRRCVRSKARFEINIDTLNATDIEWTTKRLPRLPATLYNELSLEKTHSNVTCTFSKACDRYASYFIERAGFPANAPQVKQLSAILKSKPLYDFLTSASMDMPKFAELLEEADLAINTDARLYISDAKKALLERQIRAFQHMVATTWSRAYLILDEELVLAARRIERGKYADASRWPNTTHAERERFMKHETMVEERAEEAAKAISDQLGAMNHATLIKSPILELVDGEKRAVARCSTARRVLDTVLLRDRVEKIHGRVALKWVGTHSTRSEAPDPFLLVVWSSTNAVEAAVADADVGGKRVFRRIHVKLERGSTTEDDAGLVEIIRSIEAAWQALETRLPLSDGQDRVLSANSRLSINQAAWLNAARRSISTREMATKFCNGYKINDESVRANFMLLTDAINAYNVYVASLVVAVAD